MTSESLSRRQMFATATAAGLGLGLATTATAKTKRSKVTNTPTSLLAPKPPMGWNSWNSFATTITEAQALETAQIMAERLLPSGYSIFTIDIQWYEPEASSYAYNNNPVPAMDGYGRLIPAPNRFPSAADGTGFTAIAKKVHDLGLKFGIHLMRGIPRLAVEKNLPVFGTKSHAADVADKTSTCPWNPDMYGVNMHHPDAQAYYDSVFSLYASWGVDFIKMDDMSAPYDHHRHEIEAAHAAIVKSGRPIILSLSPGETPVLRADHVKKYAQMWRISDDFWDDWAMLHAQFVRLENWNPHCGPGSWPDADMLPLGRLALGKRDTKFTPDEQQTLMSLWAIARSPLIMGGDLRYLDAATLALLTNKDMIAINQNSHENRPHFYLRDGHIWTAKSQDKSCYYLGLFNTAKDARELYFDLKDLKLTKSVKVRNIWTNKDLGTFTGRFTDQIAGHGSGLYELKEI